MKTSTPRDAVRLSSNAITVLEKRYLLKDETGTPVESPSDLFWRVARTVAQADARYGGSAQQVEQVAADFFGLMAKRLFVPNSPTLMNAGRPLGQLSACFVLPVDDALSNGKSGIYDTLRAMALVHQSGGGTGFSFSRLRPKNDIVRSTMGVASGPVSFMGAVDADGMYDLHHPKTGKVVGQLNAREVWSKIIHGAWKTGEPGVFFIDKANYYNPVPH